MHGRLAQPRQEHVAGLRLLRPPVHDQDHAGGKSRFEPRAFLIQGSADVSGVLGGKFNVSSPALRVLVGFFGWFEEDFSYQVGAFKFAKGLYAHQNGLP